MESSHLVIFSTSGKFIMKFNVLCCISLSETLFWKGGGGGGGGANTLITQVRVLPKNNWRNTHIYYLGLISVEL